MRIMSACGLKILAVSVLTVIFAGRVHAQPESLGATFSFSGISVCYEHEVNDDTFLDFAVKADTGEMYLSRERFPGISASFTWNMILKTWDSGNGQKIDLTAGTGMAFGWSKDFMKDRGFNLGLKGRVGARFRFTRNIGISVCVAPVLGMHMTLLKDSIRMEYYRYGLLNAIMPEIGIRYMF